jgi:hypothetical protein
MNNEYDPYQNPSQGYYQERRSYTADDLGYPPRGTGLLKNPIVAVLVLLVTAGVFVGIVSMSLSGGDEQEVLPVVRADQTAFKEAPGERGGMEIPNSESTVFSQMRGDADDGSVENLFAPQTEESREDVLAALEQAPNAAQDAVEAVEVTEPQEDMPSDTALAQPTQEPPKELHPAGSSPETLAFVRSVLEEKQAGEAAAAAEAAASATPSTPDVAEAEAQAVAQAEPASGASAAVATTATTAAGTHFVQLASITEEGRAAAEWSKLKEKYPALSSADYRVEGKEIAGKGMFYRIQAGPFSKDAAASACDSIKAAAGSCFVVAK